MSVVDTELWVNTPAAWSARAASVAEPWEAVGWSERSQKARFRAVLRHLDTTEEDTLFDFGCGTGEFHGCLQEYAVPVRYFGWDWAPGMRDRSRREHPRGTFIESWRYDCHFDHIVAIGPFNLSDHWTREQTWRTLSRLWALTNRTLVVSVYRGDDPQCLRYSACDLAIFAESQRVKNFAIDGSHLPNDLILRMARDR